MADCNHSAWIQAFGDEKTRSLVDTYRLQRILHSLPSPETQTPSVIFFFGQNTKNTALRHLFPHNNLKRSISDGLARLRIDNSTTACNHPVLFADASSVSSKLATSYSALDSRCHQSRALAVKWESTTMLSVVDFVYSRVLLPTCNLFVAFADDMGLQALAEILMRWISIGVLSDSPKETYPRLLIVITEKTSSRREEESEARVQIKEFYEYLQKKASKPLSSLFSQVQTHYIVDGDVSSTARFTSLKDALLRNTDEIRRDLAQNRWLFSATHLSSLFSMRLEHVANGTRNEFLTIPMCRKHHLDLESFSSHLYPIIDFGKRAAVPYDRTASLIASSLLMDAYPFGSHLFDPEFTFMKIYFKHCLDAFRAQYEEDSFADWMTRTVLKHFRVCFDRLVVENTSAHELHAKTVQRKDHPWSRMFSNETCLSCLRRPPQHVLSCSHSICDVCVSKFATPTFGEEYRFELGKCVHCDNSTNLSVKVKPPTSEARVLSIDGGGVRAVIPLRFLNLIQSVLGKGNPIHDFIDVVGGTSSGGLIALSIFHYGLTAERANDVFEQLATQVFYKNGDRPKGLFSKIQAGMKCLIDDGYYDDNVLETAIKRIFGEADSLFGFTSISGTKIIVTASTTLNATCVLFTNYNGASSRKDSCGYRVLSHTSPQEEVKVWQAARATSAAPCYFRPLKIAQDTLQDGAFAANNPIYQVDSEIGYIWPENKCPDFVLELGTGTDIESAVGFRDLFRDRFLPRSYRALMTLIDAELIHNRFVEKLPAESKDKHFRCNVQVSRLPSLDDAASMQSLQESVHGKSTASTPSLVEIGSAILTASFFFELDKLPIFSNGVFHCEGAIYCRNNIYNVVQTLHKTSGMKLKFTSEKEHLANLDGLDDICTECHKFRKSVKFTVKELSDELIIYLGSRSSTSRPISGFPQRIESFITRQRLDAHFGAPDRYFRPACHTCRPERYKRQRSLLSNDLRPKRRCA